MTEQDYRDTFLDLCRKRRRARLPGSKAVCLERINDVLDLYNTWRGMNQEKASGSQA